MSLNRRLYEIPLDQALLSKLWRMANYDNTIQNCIAFLIDRTHQGGLKFYANDENLKLSPEFQSVVNEYWLPFSKEIMHQALVQGFACYTFLQLPSGDIVPKALPPSTVRVCMKYDVLSEETKFVVYRCIGNLRIATEEVDYDDVHEQPREAMRVDIGTQIPSEMEPDPLAFVMNAFGYSPSMETGVRSPVRALMDDYDEYCIQMEVYRRQQNNITNEKPFVAPKGLGDDLIRTAIADSYAPGDSSQATEDLVRNRTAAEMQSYLTTELMMNKRRMEAGLGPSSTAMGTFLSQIGALVGSSGDSMPGGFNVIPPGSTLSNFHLQADSRHLPQFIENYKNSVRRTFQLPPHIFSESGASNQDLQQSHLESTIYTWYSLLTNILTNVYSTIYVEEDAEWYSDYIQERWLREEAYKRAASMMGCDGTRTIEGDDSPRHEPKIKNGMFSDMSYRSRKQKTNAVPPMMISEKIQVTDMDKLPTMKEIVTTDYTGDQPKKIIVPVAGYGARHEDGEEKSKKKKRQRVQEADSNSEKRARSDESDGEDSSCEAPEKYSRQYYLDIMKNNARGKDFKDLFENLKQLIEKEESKKVGRNRKSRSNITATMRIKVTLARNTFLTIPQLTSMLALGALDRSEFTTFLRSKANLQPHDGLEKYQKTLENLQELLGGINVEQVLSDTALMPVFAMEKKRQIKNEHEAVEKALLKQRVEYELAIQKLRLQMAAAAQQQKIAADHVGRREEKEGKEEAADSSTSPNRDKNGDMKKEQAEEARKSGALKTKKAEVGKKRMTDDLTSTGRKKGQSRKGNATMAE